MSQRRYPPGHGHIGQGGEFQDYLDHLRRPRGPVNQRQYFQGDYPAPPAPPPPTRQPQNIAQQIHAVNMGSCTEFLRSDGQTRKTVLQSEGCGAAGQGEITVTLGVQSETFTAGTPDLRSNMIAYVSFGIGGANYTIEADFKQGQQITVPSDAVTVAASQVEASNTSLPERVVVCASLGIRTRPSTHPVTRSYPLTDVPAGGSANFPIPPFAYAYFAYTPNAITVTGVANVAVTGADESVGYTGGQVMQNRDILNAIEAAETGGILLPNGGRTLFVNNSSGGVVPTGIVFLLAV